MVLDNDNKREGYESYGFLFINPDVEWISKNSEIPTWLTLGWGWTCVWIPRDLQDRNPNTECPALWLQNDVILLGGAVFHSE